MIRNVTSADAKAICDIYNHHALHTIVTFEEEAVGLEEMKNRIETISATYPWIVFEEDGAVIGYAYASQWKVRSAYKYTVESSVYVAEGHMGKGIGHKLYSELITRLKAQGIHNVIGGISLPNEASIKLHEAHGFKYLGKFTEVGKKFGEWIDVGYWELLL